MAKQRRSPRLADQGLFKSGSPHEHDSDVDNDQKGTASMVPFMARATPTKFKNVKMTTTTMLMLTQVVIQVKRMPRQAVPTLAQMADDADPVRRRPRSQSAVEVTIEPPVLWYAD